MITCTPIAICRHRLLNVAKALRESPHPEMFDMGQYGHGCGTPACAFGHYAFREDLQDEFSLVKSGYVVPKLNPDHWGCDWDDANVLAHFGISKDDSDRLFSGSSGCGRATTALEAAAYIERFVARKWPQWGVS